MVDLAGDDGREEGLGLLVSVWGVPQGHSLGRGVATSSGRLGITSPPCCGCCGSPLAVVASSLPTVVWLPSAAAWIPWMRSQRRSRFWRTRDARSGGIACVLWALARGGDAAGKERSEGERSEGGSAIVERPVPHLCSARISLADALAGLCEGVEARCVRAEVLCVKANRRFLGRCRLPLTMLSRCCLVQY